MGPTRGSASFWMQRPSWGIIHEGQPKQWAAGPPSSFSLAPLGTRKRWRLWDLAPWSCLQGPPTHGLSDPEYQAPPSSPPPQHTVRSGAGQRAGLHISHRHSRGRR